MTDKYKDIRRQLNEEDHEMAEAIAEAVAADIIDMLPPEGVMKLGNQEWAMKLIGLACGFTYMRAVAAERNL